MRVWVGEFERGPELRLGLGDAVKDLADRLLGAVHAATWSRPSLLTSYSYPPTPPVIPADARTHGREPGDGGAISLGPP